MKKLTLIIAYFLITSGLLAQNLTSIFGYIQDEKGHSLSDVIVKFEDIGEEPETDDNGKFVVIGDFKGGQELEVSFFLKGYKSLYKVDTQPNEKGSLGTFTMTKKVIPKDQPFNETDKSTFKVLILPFDPYATCKNTDKYCLENIRNRFEIISNENQFKIDVKTNNQYNIYTSMPFDSAEWLRNMYKADLVVWGNYEQQCAWDSSKFNIKFVTKGTYEEDLFRGQTGEGRQNIGSFRSIVEKGTLTGDVEDIVYWSLAVSYLQQGKYDEAITFFKAVNFQQKKEYAIIPCMIGWSYSQKETSTDINAENNRKALIEYNKAIRLDSRNSMIYLCRGVLYKKLNEKDKALNDFKRADYLRPNDVEILLQKSFIYKGLGLTDKSEMTYNKASDLLGNYQTVSHNNKNKAIVAYNRGIFAKKFGKYLLAIQAYTEAIRLNPNYMDAYNNRGILYNNLKKYELAMVDYTKAIELNPNYVNAYYNRGNSYYELKKYELALVDYRKAIELNPNFIEVYHNRGNSYYELKKYELALADYTKAIELNPNFIEVYHNRGNSYYKLKKYELALADYTKAIELNPNFVSAYKNRGDFYHMLKKYELALADYTKAIELNPNFVNAYHNRGNSYYELKKYELAIIDYSKTIELDPNYAYPYNNLGFIYLLQNKKELAQQNAKKSKELDPENAWIYFTFAGIALLENNETEFYNQLEIAVKKGLSLFELLDEPFLKPYLEKDQFKKLVEQSK